MTPRSAVIEWETGLSGRSSTAGTVFDGVDLLGLDEARDVIGANRSKGPPLGQTVEVGVFTKLRLRPTRLLAAASS